jgi:phosphoserine aminotransferase
MDTTGIRVSLYNAITEDQTDQLIEYIKAFVKQEKGGVASEAP